MNWNSLLNNEVISSDQSWKFYHKHQSKLVKDWTSINSQSLLEAENFVLIPWSTIPINRSNEFVIASLSPRIDFNYFLFSNEPLKNISSYSGATSIFVENPEIKKVVTHFNPSLQLSDNRNDCQLHIKLLPTNKEFWQSEPNMPFSQALSNQEFIPPVVSGILAAVTFADDIDTRKYLANFHEEDSKLIGNIERELKKHFGKHLIAAHVSNDRAYYYHSNIVVERDDAIHFHSYSQSTILDYSNNFLEKLQ